MYNKILELLGLKVSKIQTQIFEECFIRNLTKDESEKVYNYYNKNFSASSRISSEVIDVIILKLNLITP
jgi:hypothetical protein